jgi:hypothetical protein
MNEIHQENGCDDNFTKKLIMEDQCPPHRKRLYSRAPTELIGDIFSGICIHVFRETHMSFATKTHIPEKCHQ